MVGHVILTSEVEPLRQTAPWQIKMVLLGYLRNMFGFEKVNP